MQLTKNNPVSVAISEVAFGGAGIGKIQNGEKEFVVFVEDTIPGDEVIVNLTRIKKNYAEGRVREFIKRSDLRIAPRCKHFDTCGGCTFQYLDYKNQLRIKEKQVRDSVERIGGLKNVDFKPIIGCGNPWYYRNKMEYSFGEVDGNLSIGLHLPKRFADIFELDECFLQSEKSVDILKSVRDWARDKKLTSYNTFTKSGLLKSLTIREGKNTGEVMVNLTVNGNEQFDEVQSLVQLFEDATVLGVTSLYWTSVEIARGHATRQTEHHISGKEYLTEKLNITGTGVAAPDVALYFDIHPQAFFQTNTKQAEVLYGQVLKLAEAKKTDVVYDLFCGSGTIGMCFAATCQSVYGIEINKWAIDNARENATRNNLTNIEFLCADVGEVNSDQSISKPTIVVVDPPRAGITPKSLEKIIELNPKKIIYVSCNPTTFARDAKILSAKYTLKTVQPVDMFPQTYHVETIGVFL